MSQAVVHIYPFDQFVHIESEYCPCCPYVEIDEYGRIIVYHLPDYEQLILQAFTVTY